MTDALRIRFSQNIKNIWLECDDVKHLFLFTDVHLAVQTSLCFAHETPDTIRSFQQKFKSQEKWLIFFSQRKELLQKKSATKICLFPHMFLWNKNMIFSPKKAHRQSHHVEFFFQNQENRDLFSQHCRVVFEETSNESFYPVFWEFVSWDCPENHVFTNAFGAVLPKHQDFPFPKDKELFMNFNNKPLQTNFDLQGNLVFSLHQCNAEKNIYEDIIPQYATVIYTHRFSSEWKKWFQDTQTKEIQLIRCNKQIYTNGLTGKALFSAECPCRK
jgi:hypothetical protein